MKDSIYLLVNARGVRSIFKKTDKIKALPSGTILVKLNVEIPDNFFEKLIPEIDIKLNMQHMEKSEVLVDFERPPLAIFFDKIMK